MRPITLTALLLAGGQSRRMGMDKATLLIAGEPLWARQLRVLRELNPEALAVSARTRPEWCSPELAVVLDNEPSRGPLSGLAAALGGLQTSHLVVLAVDLPRMTLQHLRELLARAGSGSGVVPERDGRLEPLCAIYPAEAAAIAAEALSSGDVSLQSFARRLQREGRIQVLPVDGTRAGFYHNLNAPEDLPV